MRSWVERDDVDIHIELDGDACSVWLPLAKKFAANLHDVVGPNGYGSKDFGKIGDCFIRVAVSPGVRKLFLRAESGVEMLHGMVSQGSIVEIGPEDAKEPALSEFYPSPEQAAAEGVNRDFRDEPALSMSADPEIDLPSANLPYGQAGVIAPSLYTGQMAKAVQLALGLVQDEPIQFRWGIKQTHGIMKANDGTPWLIEIGMTYGVMATRLPTLASAEMAIEALQAEVDALGYIPTGEAFPTLPADLTQAIIDGDVKILLASAGMAPFYNKAAFFADCGWAFSETGYEAQNTCWSWPDDYKRGHRFKVSIGRDSLGEPVSATLSEVEQGYLYNWPLKESRLYFPAESNGFKVETFDMQKTGGSVGPRPAASWTAPVFVFYDGNAEQVYRQVGAGGSAFDVSEPKHETGLDDKSYLVNDGPATDSAPSYNPTAGFSGPGVLPDLSYSGGNRTSTRYIVRGTGSYEAYAAVSSNGEIYGDFICEWSTGYRQSTAFNNFFKGRKSSLVISPRNRSSVFVAQAESTNYETKTYTSLAVGAGPRRGAPVLLGGWGGFQRFPVENYKIWGSSTSDSGSNSSPFPAFPTLTYSPYEQSFASLDAQIAGGYQDPFNGQLGSLVDGRESYGDAAAISAVIGVALSGPQNNIPDESSTQAGQTVATKKVTALNAGSITPLEPDVNFDYFYEVSPSIGGTHVLFNSGYSAFRMTRFQSKGPNAIYGPDLDYSSPSGYPINEAAARISFVGVT